MENKELYFDLFCPECGNLNRVDFSNIEDSKKGNFQVDCSCKSAIPISVDFRRFYRKKVNNLDGAYKNLSNGNAKGKMRIIDISINGIGFVNNSLNALSVGDEIKLNFILDDNEESEIEVTGIVRHATGNNVGCELTTPIKNRKALEQYLLP
jgi:hypothetical protein